MDDKKFGIKVAVSGRKVRSDACPLPLMLRKSQVRRWNVSILITTPAKMSIVTALFWTWNRLGLTLHPYCICAYILSVKNTELKSKGRSMEVKYLMQHADCGAILHGVQCCRLFLFECTQNFPKMYQITQIWDQNVATLTKGLKCPQN